MGPRRTGDEGAVVLGGLTKLVVSLTAVAVLGFDAVSLVVARFSAEDDAGEAARVAALAYRDSKSPQVAYDAAVEAVIADGATIAPETFLVAADGSVTLTLATEATTLVAHRVEQFDDWRSLVTTVSARPPI